MLNTTVLKLLDSAPLVKKMCASLNTLMARSASKREDWKRTMGQNYVVYDVTHRWGAFQVRTYLCHWSMWRVC
jgi:hypothetical protein